MKIYFNDVVLNSFRHFTTWTYAHAMRSCNLCRRLLNCIALRLNWFSLFRSISALFHFDILKFKCYTSNAVLCATCKRLTRATSMTCVVVCPPVVVNSPWWLLVRTAPISEDLQIQRRGCSPETGTRKGRVQHTATPHRAVFGFRSHASPTAQCANWLGCLHHHSASGHIQPPAGSRGPQITEWYRHGTRSKSFHFPPQTPYTANKDGMFLAKLEPLFQRTPLHSQE